VRIAHVTDSYLPRVGGIELHVHDLAAQQRAIGHDAVVLTSGVASSGDGVPVRSYRGFRGLLTPEDYRLLRNSVSADGFDAVHAHLSLVSPMAWVAVRAAVRSGVPVVVTMHSMAPPGQLAPLLRSLDRAAGSIVWTAVSEAAARPLRQALGDRPVAVLRNGIEPDEWREVTVRRPGGPLTLVSVMRMSRRKRPVPLIGVLADIRRRVPACQPLRAVLVGAGPRAGAVARATRRLGVQSWVELAGQLDHTQIRHLLAETDLYLSPARSESFGLAALEARCAGVPVVAMSCGGAGEFVSNGVEGFLVEDDADMARAAAHVLGTPALLQQMRQHNRRTLPGMTWSTVVAQNLAAYEAAGAAREPEPVASLASP
jgi:glycosyltransferase involved in cell wall biosynthesis